MYSSQQLFIKFLNFISGIGQKYKDLSLAEKEVKKKYIIWYMLIIDFGIGLLKHKSLINYL